MQTNVAEILRISPISPKKKCELSLRTKYRRKFADISDIYCSSFGEGRRISLTKVCYLKRDFARTFVCSKTIFESESESVRFKYRLLFHYAKLAILYHL